MTRPDKELYETILGWEQTVRDPRDSYPFRVLLDELLFHGQLRFDDYKQFREEGLFPTRLKGWLNNAAAPHAQRTLLRLLAHLIFIDAAQFVSLYRDVYRRIIIPWMSAGQLSADELVAPDLDLRLRGLLGQFGVYSVTESFDGSDFLKANNLAGLPKFRVLGERLGIIETMLPSPQVALSGLIILEDFVGTGKQAARILNRVADLSHPAWRILFVPLLVLERGDKTLRRSLRRKIEYVPGITIPSRLSIQPVPLRNEDSEFAEFRALIKRTASRVLQRLNQHDDPPTDPFGFKQCGAIFVTSHNSPNNTLPILHHRAPDWFPLFRRLHHAKGDL